jgi:N-acetylmuramoyl-L-alanine amidase
MNEMYRIRMMLRLITVLCVLVLFRPAAVLAMPEVTGARIGTHPDSTRLVLELSEPVPYQLFTLDKPYRVVVDFPEVRWRARHNPMRASTGLVSGFRFGLFQSDNSRVVLETNVPTIISKHFILEAENGNPTRFVLDLKETSRAAFRPGKTIQSAGWKTVVQRRARAPGARRPASPGRHVIVLDPGHGGVDPGAIGVTGAYEKKITMAIAREAKRIFEVTGRYRVVLTRGRDVYIRLRDRFEIAHRNKAELFISLHADSIRNRKIQGGSVYTLSNRASDKEAASLATRENKSDIIAGADLSGYAPEVSEILIDLAQGATNKESWFLAEMLVKELGRRTKLLRNSHRFAGFAVLKSPNVPSVLLELGYLSNRTDEKKLSNPAYRTRIARALLQAVDKYFERKTKLRKS